MFICKAIEGNQCTEWLNVSDSFAWVFDTQAGLEVGAQFFGLCIIAYIGRIFLTIFLRDM